MNNNYVALKNFTDKETNQQYKAGEMYSGNRASDLERMGYIAAEGSEKALQANSQTSQTANAANNQGGAYSMVNGQRVTLQEAQAQAEKNKNVKASELDRNETEAVNTGEVASGSGANVTHNQQVEQQAKQQEQQQAQQQSGYNIDLTTATEKGHKAAAEEVKGATAKAKKKAD